MGNDHGERAYVKILCALCICILCVIMSAGLWPFHVPANQVRWLKDRDGLEFGRHGSAITSGAIRASNLDDASETLEIWLEPARSKRSSTILSFEGSVHPGEPFSLHQRRDALSIRLNNVDPQGVSRTALFYVDRAFWENKPIFVTVALDSQKMSVYLNGDLARVLPLTGTWNNLTGKVVLANSPTANNSWSGKIFGLAIYQRELGASQTAADYANWMAKGRPAADEDGPPAALYLFDEQGGAVARNIFNPATDLIIPKHYLVLHPGFMVAPWTEYHPTWSYWQDVVVNIAGFVPFGFFAFAYLSLMRAIKHPGITTVILGLFTSLTIELLQALLPTRSSDTTDVITNTLGMALGVMVCRASIAQTLLAKAEAAIANTSSSRVRNAESIW